MPETSYSSSIKFTNNNIVFSSGTSYSVTGYMPMSGAIYTTYTYSDYHNQKKFKDPTLERITHETNGIKHKHPLTSIFADEFEKFSKR